VKKKFVLRISEETYNAIEKWAADEFRSANGQIEWILDQALKENGRMPPKVKKASMEKERKLGGENLN